MNRYLCIALIVLASCGNESNNAEGSSDAAIQTQTPPECELFSGSDHDLVAGNSRATAVPIGPEGTKLKVTLVPDRGGLDFNTGYLALENLRNMDMSLYIAQDLPFSAIQNSTPFVAVESESPLAGCPEVVKEYAFYSFGDESYYLSFGPTDLEFVELVYRLGE
jgi:hypothetical protein